MAATKRLRLLALVDMGYSPSWARRNGTQYDVHRGDSQWFRDNIPCQAACPAGTDVPGYIALLADGRYRDSLDLNWHDNVLPACLGRVCARPCEDVCRRRFVDEPINICSLKRLAADVGKTPYADQPLRQNGCRVAIVGAGPAGLAAARELAIQGYRVTIYERQPVPGGMLAVGIPAWRLPRDVVEQEIEQITRLGIDIHCNVEIGRDIDLDNVVQRFDAVLLALGCQQSATLGIPGEELAGVISGLDYLERVSLGTLGNDAGTKPVIIGGGYTSIDCARTARRFGASHPMLAYRRGRSDLSVDVHEVEEAEREGVELLLNASPTRVLGHNGAVSGVEFTRTRNERQSDGSMRLATIPGSEFIVDADQVIVAIGQRARTGIDRSGLLGGPTRNGAPVVDSGFRTSHPKIWAFGDYAVKPRNLISAIADGKRAAESVNATLTGVPDGPKSTPTLTQLMPAEEPSLLHELLAEGSAHWTVTTPHRRLRLDDDYLSVPRQPIGERPVDERAMDMPAGTTTEVETGYSLELGAREAQRCLQCQLNIFIDESRCILCNGCVEVCPNQCISMVPLDEIDTIDGDPNTARLTKSRMGDSATAMIIDEEACIRCGKCVDRCPTGCLSMDHFRP